MKKFLSIFIALAMVLSLFAGVGARSAKAAAATMTVSGLDTALVAGTARTVTVTVAGDHPDYLGAKATWTPIIVGAGVNPLSTTPQVVLANDTFTGTFTFTPPAAGTFSGTFSFYDGVTVDPLFTQNVIVTTRATSNAATTVAASAETDTTATLNGLVGDAAAAQTSFWWMPTASINWNITNVNPGSASTFALPAGSYAAGSSFTASATNLTPNTEYSFVAWNLVSGTWLPGAVLTFTTLTAAGTPGATTLTAVPGNAQVTLNWTAVTANPAVDHYSVYQGATLLGTTTGLTFTATGLTNGVSYSFTVVAHNASGDGTVSNTATATPLSGVLGTISGLAAVSTETGKPTYTFVDNTTVTGFYYSPTSATRASGDVGVKVTDDNTYGLGVDTEVIASVFQTGLNTFMFTFPLSSPILHEGFKTITVTDASNATVTQKIYVAYKVTATTNPAPALHQSSFIYGTVSNANGAATVVGNLLHLVNGVQGTGAADTGVVVTAGAFAFAYDFPTRGDYRLVLSNATGTLCPTYQKWSLGGTITATTVLDPNPLYAIDGGIGIIAAQESYLYLGYDDGTPVTNASISAPTGINTGFVLAQNYGNGFYKFSGPTSAASGAGNNYYTITAGGLTISYTLYFQPASSVWNPYVTIRNLEAYHPGGTIAFVAKYGVVSPSYTAHDSYTSYAGPGKAYSISGAKNFAIQKGGQISITLDANLWYTSTDDEQTAKPVNVEQKFTVNPAVVGDAVTISATKANVGDTKDITVTVKQANGIERNNGRVTLIGDVPNMFTVPFGSLYQAIPTATGEKLVLDAINNNLNIVGGNYVFSGVTFNHAGHIEVLVEGTDPTDPTSTVPTYHVTADYPVIHAAYYDAWYADPVYYAGIIVSPQVHTLTTDVSTFTTGVSYPVVNVTGAVTGLTNWKVADAYGESKNGNSDVPTTSVKDNLNGSYTLNVAAVGYSFGSVSAYAYDTTGDQKYVATWKVQWPTFTFTSVHKDGKITDSFAEDVTLQITDPTTGSAIIPSSSEFVPQTLGSSDVLANGDPYLDVIFADTGIATSKIMSTSASTYDVTTNTVKFTGLQATKGNQYVDYTANAPTLYLHAVANGVDLYLFNALTVTAPSITLDKPANGTLVQGKVNAIAVTAKDAHGQALSRAAVALAGNSSAAFYGNTITTSSGVGGITLPDGTVSWNTLKTDVSYVGAYRLVLGVPIYSDPPTNSIIVGYNVVFRMDVSSVATPVDTTAPVITVADGIDGSTVSSDVLMLKGTVTDDNDTISYIYINGVQVNVVGGAFTYAVKLVAGENVITLQAADSVPNLATKTIKVTLKAAAAKTVIMLTIGTDVVTVNGKATSIDAVPEIVNGRTFVPIRFIAETFGATVDWLAETQGITVTLGDSTIGLQIGNATAVIDGNIISLEAAPYIKNGRTMVPLRVISEAFGGDVAWDPALRTITISY